MRRGLGALIALAALVPRAGRDDASGKEPPLPSVDGSHVGVADDIPLIAPAKSTGTGLLLEPPLDLDWYTFAKFEKRSTSVGPQRVRRPWTSPVVKLPPPQVRAAKNLSVDEVKRYMLAAKGLFDRGAAIPLSDVGLVSTQEDVVRQPMLNHISAFENAEARVYLLVQGVQSDDGYGYFSIVQDMTRDPPLDYYAQVFEDDVKFEGTSCYKCHSSGPLAIHPAREDLVLDAKLAAAIGHRIAEQPRSEFHFPADSPRPPRGKQLTLEFCAECHAEDGIRAPLYQVHSHVIRVLVDFGYMPPDERLNPEQIAELKSWLDDRDEAE